MSRQPPGQEVFARRASEGPNHPSPARRANVPLSASGAAGGPSGGLRGGAGRRGLPLPRRRPHQFLRLQRQVGIVVRVALGEQLLILAQQVSDAAMLVAAHRALGSSLFYLGAVASALPHFVQGMALYDAQQHRTAALAGGGCERGAHRTGRGQRIAGRCDRSEAGAIDDLYAHGDRAGRTADGQRFDRGQPPGDRR